MDLIKKVRNIIKNEHLIEDGDNVLVCLSGGIDSTALLYVLAVLAGEIHFKIGIAHVNHLLRGKESERDQRFVEDLAAQFSVPCHVNRYDVKAYAEEKGISLQHAGRNVRYDFFEKTALEHGYSKIAIAHNLDDQIETFVLRMIKGSGIKGLSSIPMKRDKIIRPLLKIYRSEIERYVNESNIRYVEDSSNKKTKYERNFVRTKVVPTMEMINPAFKEKIFFLLRDITHISGFFENRAAMFLESNTNRDKVGEISFLIESLKSLDDETRFRVFAYAAAFVRPGYIMLREHCRLVEKILYSNRPNLVVVLPHHINVIRVYDRLVFTECSEMSTMLDVARLVSGKNVIEALKLIVEVKIEPRSSTSGDAIWKEIKESGGYTAYLDAGKVGSLFLRTFREGDRFVPLGMQNSVKLKDFFISRKIPIGQRRHVPLIASNNDIIWVVGYRIDDRYKVSDHTKELLMISIEHF